MNNLWMLNIASAIGIPRSTPKTTSNPELSFSISTSKSKLHNYLIVYII